MIYHLFPRLIYMLSLSISAVNLYEYTHLRKYIPFNVHHRLRLCKEGDPQAHRAVQ
jgi:hypothetical protein